MISDRFGMCVLWVTLVVLMIAAGTRAMVWVDQALGPLWNGVAWLGLIAALLAVIYSDPPWPNDNKRMR